MNSSKVFTSITAVSTQQKKAFKTHALLEMEAWTIRKSEDKAQMCCLLFEHLSWMSVCEFSVVQCGVKSDTDFLKVILFYLFIF